MTHNDTSRPATRRKFIGGAAIVGAAVAAPYIRNAEAATTTTWKIQTSWPAGVGLNTFKTWCNSIKEKTGGELELKPFAAKEVVGDFELLDGVKNGVLEAMNSFCVYWVGKIPATAFLSSYLMGLRYPHEWDIFFYGKDGVKMAREVYAKQGLFWVGRVHHGPNIVHSKKPIRSIEDFKDLKLRFIWVGPPGLESIYQPVDLMDVVVNMNVWNKLSPQMKLWFENEVEAYSALHFGAIQKADMETWPKFEKAGTQVFRMPSEDLEKWQRIATPIWFKWANKDKDAARVFKAQLEIMESPTCGYVTPDMYKGQKINL